MFPVVEGDNLLGCVTTRQIKDIPRDKWTLTKVVMRCSPDNTVAPHKDTAALVAALAKHGANSRFTVVEEGRLLGFISLKDLMGFISLKLELESDN